MLVVSLNGSAHVRVGHRVLLLVGGGALADVHEAQLPAVHNEHVLRERRSVQFSSVQNALLKQSSIVVHSVGHYLYL